MRPPACATLIFAALVAARGATAAETAITWRGALDRAAHLSPDLAVARAHEAVARADVGIAGQLPNPSLTAGTSTQAAKLSLGVSVPLLIFGQRGAAIEAGKADLETSRVETEIAAVDIRAATAHAYIALWRAQAVAAAQAQAAAVARRLEDAVAGRIELGASANVDGLRSHAERLRADAAAQQASRLVSAAGSELGHWLGMDDGSGLRAAEAPVLPPQSPSFADLTARVDGSPNVRREQADEEAGRARVAREKALVRPGLAVDLGLDAWDPTLCPNGPCSNPPVNYRGGLTLDVPVLNQRGPQIAREQANVAAARARFVAERTRLTSALASAYRTFEAWSDDARALTDGVVPAANLAASAAEESYTLGRAPLIAVLDAEKARIDASLSLIDARAQQADAWVDVEHAVGIRTP